MIRLASFLLLLVLARNYAPDWIGSTYADPGMATRAWDYVFGGVQGFALFCIIVYLVRGVNLWDRVGVMLASWWGLMEEGQRAGCRLAMGIENIPSVPAFSGVCEALTGWPVIALSGGIVITIVLFADVQWRPK